MSELSDPLLTCESVLAEASFLLRRGGINPSILVELVARGILEMPIDFQRESSGIARFMQRYDSVPMSLADACLVRLSELHERSRVFTLDSDFRIYRRSGRKVIPLLAPWS
jgi:predicted nucleic acid-binding protein